MPVYDYQCDDCGPFSEMRPMAECEKPSSVRSAAIMHPAPI